MAQCSSCGAEIIWIETVAGKRHPVNAKPIKLWVEVGVVDRVDTNGNPIMKDQWQLEDCYESHFATCPDADKHRRKV